MSKELLDPPGVKVTLGKLNDTVGPEGSILGDKVTEPANPALVSMIVDVPEVPADTVRDGGFAVMLKSPDTVTVTSTE